MPVFFLLYSKKNDKKLPPPPGASAPVAGRLPQTACPAPPPSPSPPQAAPSPLPPPAGSTTVAANRLVGLVETGCKSIQRKWADIKYSDF